MSHEKLIWMKDCLVCAVEEEMCDLESADIDELGEAIDMIKDLEEAIYYATVTEAMLDPQNEKMWKIEKSDHPHESESDRQEEYVSRSNASRKMYMEARHMNKDKATQLRELEKYMQELASEIVEMITDASPEEKQYLEKKITALAAKVSQMK